MRTLTTNHDLTIVNAGATGFSKDPVAFVLLVEPTQRMGGSYGKARIDLVRHDVEELEDARGRAGYRDYYIVDYSFTSEGRTYYGSASLDESPIDLEGDAEATPQLPVFLDIEYQTRNPDNNRALASASKLQHIFPSLVFLALGLGAVFWSLKSSRTAFLTLKSGKL